MSEIREIAGYRVLAKVGEGAASELFAVQDRKSKQVWALKHVIKHNEKDQRFLDQVITEYQVGSKLDHPNIRTVYRMVRHRKMFKTCAISLLLELVDGQSLDKQRPKTLLEAVRIFTQIASGLAHMHKRGFAHADMKPANVLITHDNQVKIIDLGQGCAIGTVKERIQGTPGYMAPEQAHRQSVTEKTDIYNFGAMMYWMLTQEVIPTALPPKDNGNNSLYSGAIDASRVEPPVPPHKKNADVHPLLSRQILDCVQIHPDDRPETMELVHNRLELIGDLLESPDQASEFAMQDDESTA